MREVGILDGVSERRGRGGRRTARRTDDRAARAVWGEGARVARGKVSDVKKALWRDRDLAQDMDERNNACTYYTQQSTLPSPGLGAHCVCWQRHRSFGHNLKSEVVIETKSKLFTSIPNSEKITCATKISAHQQGLS